MDVHLRDTIIIFGGDGNYYLTGLTGDNIWKYNDGIELWKSPDLIYWNYLGLDDWELPGEGAVPLEPGQPDVSGVPQNIPPENATNAPPK